MKVRVINYLIVMSILFLLVLLLYNFFIFDNFIFLLEKYLSSDNHLDKPFVIISMFYALFVYFIGILFLLKRYLLGSNDIIPKKIELLQYRHYGVLVLIIGLFLIFGESQKNIDDTIFKEDGFFENMTILLVLISSSIFFYLGIYYKAIEKKIFLLLFSILLFLFAMEEISWGQLIFDLQTPETLRKINYQNEINVHNIYINSYISVIYYMFFLFVSSLFLFRDKYVDLLAKNKITKIISEMYPSIQFFYAGFIYLFIAFATLKVDDELSEELLTITIFIYTIEVLHKKFKLEIETI